MATRRPLSGRLVTGVLAPIGIAAGAMVAGWAGLPPGACFDVAWTAAALSALVGALAARGSAQRSNRPRWTMWALAAGSWLFGQICWDVMGVLGFPGSPNLADLGWWGFAIFVIAGALRLPRGSRSVRRVAVVEAMPLIGAALAFCLAGLWPVALGSHLGVPDRVSALIYPGLYVAAAILLLHTVLGGSLRGHSRLPLKLVLGGIAAQALAFTLWSDKLLDGTYVPGDWLLDPLWVIGLAAIGVGGLLTARDPEPPTRLPEPSPLGAILPAAMFVALFVAFVWARVTGGDAGSITALEAGLLFSGAALIVRSTLLGRRVQRMLDRERETLAAAAERETELGRLNERLLEDSRRDALTGIGNRRALSDDLPMYQARQRDRGERFALALCDVDHFKLYNDQLGHLAGDQALRMLAATVRSALRDSDTAYRFGGEELLIVLRAASDHDAIAVAERVRTAVEHAAFPHPGGAGRILTVSIGVAAGDEEFGQVLARADAALYEAKRGGRNRVVLAAGDGPVAPSRPREEPEAPVPHHLRSMLALSRAAASGAGPIPLLDALCRAIVSELSFQTVAVNLLEDGGETMRVALVLGDVEARRALMESTRPAAELRRLLATGKNVHGASWLVAGTYDWNPALVSWTPPSVAAPMVDAWDPEDMLLLPLRGADGDLLGIVSVDQPRLGRRPSVDEIGVLMAVVDHAGLALEQAQRRDAAPGADDRSTELRLAALMLLAETLDLRDPGTGRHSRTVGRLARTTAIELGLGDGAEDPRIERIHAAAVLHDLGKLGIADAILQKTGPLDDAEWDEMRTHPEVGARIVERAGMPEIAAWVRAHHERVDGGGYPAGLPGDQIPLEARILAVADAYEAMRSDRPYHAGISAEAAREELRRCSGTQFDPEVVEAFLRALDRDGAAAGCGGERDGTLALAGVD
jgi:diguanylate cyclase (GGDEF)-like protein